MFFESFKKILFSDTLVPDIFLTEYMPSMDGNHVKVYLYCSFLSKYNKQASTREISKKLEISEEVVKDSFTFLESLGIIIRSENGILLNDLKEKELNKIYRIKTTSTPEEAVLSSERNKKRNSIITAINNMFFQGVMPPSWYTDIDAWFDTYKFEDDVMLSLFQHCYDHKGLSKNYIARVAADWHSKNIVNYFDLEKHLEEYQKFKDIRGKIAKKLKLNRNLTEYEEEYVETWAMQFKYNFDIIDLCLKKTTAKTNPNFKYIHAILTSWFKQGLKTVEEVNAYITSQKTSKKAPSGTQKQIAQHKNFDQRKYDKEFFDKVYENTGN